VSSQTTTVNIFCSLDVHGQCPQLFYLCCQGTPRRRSIFLTGWCPDPQRSRCLRESSGTRQRDALSEYYSYLYHLELEQSGHERPLYMPSRDGANVTAVARPGLIARSCPTAARAWSGIDKPEASRRSIRRPSQSRQAIPRRGRTSDDLASQVHRSADPAPPYHAQNLDRA